MGRQSGQRPGDQGERGEGVKRVEVYRPRYVTVASRWQMMLRPWSAILDGRPMDGEDPATHWTWADARRGTIGVIARDDEGRIETVGEGVSMQPVIRALHGTVEIEGKTAGEIVAGLRQAARSFWRFKIFWPLRRRRERTRRWVYEARWALYRNILPDMDAALFKMRWWRRVGWLLRARIALAIAPDPTTRFRDWLLT